MSELATQIAAFRENIMDSGYVLDPEPVHSEFVSGKHGRKLDFDKIDDDDPLYKEWTEIAADFIQQEFPRLPEVIIGVANGTNRTALDTARRFNGQVLGLVSEKDPDNSKRLYLSSIAGRAIEAIKPELVVVLEDVGTTGSNSVQVAVDSRDAGARSVEVVTTWQRREHLERLEEAGIPHRAIINEPLPTYTPEECRSHGFCAEGWEFKPRKQ
jgi:orotate phosphoribosyltransferase